MGPTDSIVIAVILLVIGLAAFYVIRAKKKGAKCIGCPDGCNCPGASAGCSGNCGGCGGHTDA